MEGCEGIAVCRFLLQEWMRTPHPALTTGDRLKSALGELSSMPTIEVDEETIDRLDGLKVEEESYDEIINELINIYEAEELTLFRAGD